MLREERRGAAQVLLGLADLERDEYLVRLVRFTGRLAVVEIRRERAEALRREAIAHVLDV